MSWQTTPYLAMGALLVVGFALYERRRPPSEVVALVAAMAALAIVGRLAFAAVPGVKPSTDIVLFSGFALGAVPGFVVGALCALVSNLFLGQGPWTIWQMAGWGAVGVAGAALARVAAGRVPGRAVLAAACAVAALGFGAFMDLYQWSLAAEQTTGAYAAISATSLPYNAAHVLASVAFCLLAGPAFVSALARYRRRFEGGWAAAAPASDPPSAATH